MEVTRFKGKSSEALVPRIIGRQSDHSRNRLTSDEFLGKFEDAGVRAAVRRLLDVAAASGASIFLGTRGVSIRAHCPLFGQPVTVAWIYPPSSPGWMRGRDFTFGAGNGTSNGLKFGMELPDKLEERLRHWVNEFRDDSFDDASSEGVVAYSLKPGEAVEVVDLLESRMSKVIADIASLN